MAAFNARLRRWLMSLAGLTLIACVCNEVSARPTFRAITVRDAAVVSGSITEQQTKEMIFRFLDTERPRQQKWLQASREFVMRGGALTVSRDDENARFLWGPWEINVTSRRAKLISIWPGGQLGYQLNADIEHDGARFVLARVRFTEIRGIRRK
ncbi:MAG TPA: hypothetical protein VMV10_08265 [Pirellulales bacterium]|nr:hypothetical protein [Pirellulales bacterium]